MILAFFTTAGMKSYESEEPGGASSLRARGREGAVAAQDINKETLKNSSDCRHDDDSTFVSGDVDLRKKS